MDVCFNFKVLFVVLPMVFEIAEPHVQTSKNCEVSVGTNHEGGRSVSITTFSGEKGTE